MPVFKNGYFYYTRSVDGGQYYKYCRKKDNLDAPEELLLDVDQMAEGYAYYSLSGFAISPDNYLLAFGMDDSGRRQYSIKVKDLRTGQLRDDHIFPTNGHAVWANDSITFFYTATNPDTLLSEKIYRHTVGSFQEADVLVYHELDKSNYIGIHKTRSQRYIIIQSKATLSSEIWFLPADEAGGDFQLFQSRIPGLLYSVDHCEDHFLVLTNWEAVNFRLMRTPVSGTGRDYWQELVPHRPEVLLQGVDPFSDHLVISERAGGLTRFRITDLQAQNGYYLDFEEPAYSAHAGSNPEYNTACYRFGYTSLTTPSSTYDYDLATREKRLMKEQEIPGGYDRTQYFTDRLQATAADGTAVPISVVYKKGFALDGRSPLLLYGYGSYGISIDPSFSIARLSLLDRGFAFAIAHVRGGQELGRQWYDNGKLLQKMNSFTDFICCAEYLIRERYTSPAHLYAMGGSAGGLLMGAIANLRPELWKGIIASVPFVDVVTTMLDESIPLTTNEFDEWGNPKIKRYYDYMKSYSPYDNVRGELPNMLVVTGLHDSQVQYFEPAKWVARIRALKTNETRVLMSVNMSAGHGGASGRFNYLKEIALQYSFLLALENEWRTQ